MAQKEIKALTGLRGVSAVYVVVFHFYQFCLNSLKGQDHFLLGKYTSAILTHGYLAVDVFFMLSAFVITLSSARLFEGRFEVENYKLFMRKRWLRLYPSYFIIAVYGYVAVYHFHRTPNFILSLTLLNLVFGVHHIFLHLWSLGAEWITYMIYPVYYKAMSFSKKWFWKYVVIGAGVLALYMLGVFNTKHPAGDYTLVVSNPHLLLLRCFADYIIGMGIYMIYKENKYAFLNTNLAAGILTLAIVGTLFFPKLDVLTVLLFMLLIVAVSKDEGFVSKILSSKVAYFLGVISYPLYLINSVVFLEMEGLQSFLKNYLHTNSIYSLAAAFMAICLVLATIFTYLIEMPLIAYLGKLVGDGGTFFRKKLSTANS